MFEDQLSEGSLDSKVCLNLDGTTVKVKDSVVALIRVRVARLENGQYLATSDDVPGLVAQGRTKSEATSIARRWSGWQNPTFHVCTDPSHPTLVQFPKQQKTLYQQVVDKVRASTGSIPPDTGVVASVSGEVRELLSHPSDGVSEGFRLQQMRQTIAKEWETEFCKLENLAYLAGWFMLDCIKEKGNSELRFVLCLLGLESIRGVFATVSQLRAALVDETFGYWRTLYETSVTSQFLVQFTKLDPDLPGRFSRYTNSIYLDFYNRFSPSDGERMTGNTWSDAEEFYARQYRITGKGQYGWAHPSISARKPTFRQVAEAIDGNPAFLNKYYAFATSKTHGRFILGFDGIRPSRSKVISFDPFTTGNIASVLEFTIPLFETVLVNAGAFCSKTEHKYVLNAARTIIAEMCDEVTAIKAKDPGMHG